MKRSHPFLLLLLVGLTVVGVWIANGCRPTTLAPGHSSASSREGNSADALPPDGQDVVALGRIEPVGGIIRVGAIVGDQLQELRVTEGDHVKADDQLATLASRRLRELEVESIESQIEEAKSLEQSERASAEAKLNAADVDVEKAQAALEEFPAHEEKMQLLEANHALALEDQQRLEELHGKNPQLVSSQDLERQKLVVQRAASEPAVARAEAATMKRTAQLNVRAALAQKAVVEAGLAKISAVTALESLHKRRELAKEQLQKTVVLAPTVGTILKIHVRPGEVIGQMPLLEMADLSRMRCIVEVYQSDVKRVSAGQEAVVTSRAFSAPFDEDGLQGTVTGIGTMISSPALRSLDPFAQKDRRVVEVVVELDDPSTAEAARLVNLQVDVRIRSEGG